MSRAVQRRESATDGVSRPVCRPQPSSSASAIASAPAPSGTGPEPSSEAAAWVADVRAGVRTAAQLHRLPLAEPERAALGPVAEAFKVRIPGSYLDLIDWDDPDDPIRRQAVPDPRELQALPGERPDPIGDAAHSPVPHLTHRYPDRVLLFPTYRCSMYCRHCFRKEALAEETRGASLAHLEPALRYIAEHSELREVILTGGDPLTLGDAQLRRLRERIEAIEHVRLLRVHTRVPVTLPTRVTPALVSALRGRLMTVVVTHFNHPREITADATVACRRLREAGIVLLNQSVLLRGINDDPEVMKTLLRELVYTLGAKPYYLHHCDLTRGVSHFRTSLDEGLALMQALRGSISGLCVPHYMLDLPGGHGKVALSPEVVQSREGRRWRLRGWDGRVHDYEEQLRPDAVGEAAASDHAATSGRAATSGHPAQSGDVGSVEGSGLTLAQHEARAGDAARALWQHGTQVLSLRARRSTAQAGRGLRRLWRGLEHRLGAARDRAR